MRHSALAFISVFSALSAAPLALADDASIRLPEGPCAQQALDAVFKNESKDGLTVHSLTAPTFSLYNMTVADESDANVTWKLEFNNDRWNGDVTLVAQKDSCKVVSYDDQGSF